VIERATTLAAVAALGLPANTRVDRRIPKKLLIEQGAPTSADKRRIQDGVEDLLWIAALKPTNIGISAFYGADDEVEREYLEIAVLTATLRTQAKTTRLIELIHRAIPYPVVLFSESETPDEPSVVLSLAHKRRAKNEPGKMVIEELHKSELYSESLSRLALSSLPASNLLSMYQGLIDRVMALESARITGIYVPPDSEERSKAMWLGLNAHANLTRELALLRAQAAKEKQINRRIELNLQIKRLEADLSAHTDALRTSSDS